VSESTSPNIVSILEVPSSQVSRRFYKPVVKNAAGELVSGAEVTMALTGDGSFAPNFRSQEIKRVTGDNGEAEVFTWYRFGIYLRDCKSRIEASAGEGQNVELIETDDPKAEVKISYVPTEIKLKPQRV
jgi:hypothetical protein